MTDREPLSKKLRFEIFKRDSFTCQYCGRKAPDVILQCDHVRPVIDGGTNDILNLITACFDCNSGKGPRKLSDRAILDKQLDQLTELQERRDQIEMMIEWREQLSQLDVDVVIRLEERWTKLIEGRFGLTAHGRDSLKKYVSKYGVDLVLRAMEESCVSYLRRGTDEKFTKESVADAFGSIGRVANVLKQSERQPYLKRLFYIRGILRNRLHYCNDRMAMSIMTTAAQVGVTVEEIEHIAKVVRNWSQFVATIEAATDDAMGGADGSDQDD